MTTDVYYQPKEEPWMDTPYPGIAGVNVHTNRVMHAINPVKYHYTHIRNTEFIYSDALDQLILMIRARIRSDQQTIIHIGGATGSGKSSLGLNVAVKLCKALGQTWDIRRDYVLTAEDLTYRIHYGADTGVVLMDEAHTTLASTNAMSKDSRAITDLFTTMRSKHFTTIMVSPTINKINHYISQNFVDFRLECSSPQRSWIKGIGRGLFQVYVPESNRFRRAAEPWWNLIMTGVFPDYPECVRKPYLEAKSMHQQRVTQQQINRAIKEDKTTLDYYAQIYGDVVYGGIAPGNAHTADYTTRGTDPPEDGTTPDLEVPTWPDARRAGSAIRRNYRKRAKLDEQANDGFADEKPKRGRPKGAKDSMPRHRRTMEELGYRRTKK